MGSRPNSQLDDFDGSYSKPVGLRPRRTACDVNHVCHVLQKMGYKVGYKSDPLLWWLNGLLVGSQDSSPNSPGKSPQSRTTRSAAVKSSALRSSGHSITSSGIVLHSVTAPCARSTGAGWTEDGRGGTGVQARRPGPERLGSEKCPRGVDGGLNEQAGMEQGHRGGVGLGVGEAG